MEGHSGAAGDCEDMVINRLIRQCAFVEDINTSQLSGSWQSRPADVSARDWVCPQNFFFRERLLGSTNNPQPPSQVQATPSASAPNKVLLPIMGLVCLCGFSLLVIIVVVIIVLRQRKKNTL
jgi:hypothetical protein